MPAGIYIEPIRQSVFLLSLSSEKQIELLCETGCLLRDDIRFSDTIEDLPDDFFESMVPVISQDPTEMYGAFPGLEKLNEFMERAFADQRMFTVQALKFFPEWDVIRKLAEQALRDPGLGNSVWSRSVSGLSLKTRAFTYLKSHSPTPVPVRPPCRGAIRRTSVSLRSARDSAPASSPRPSSLPARSRRRGRRRPMCRC
ncbi:hypothetical protein MTsPCn7_17770 [Altererythrobacter sp. MTPC7]